MRNRDWRFLEVSVYAQNRVQQRLLEMLFKVYLPDQGSTARLGADVARGVRQVPFPGKSSPVEAEKLVDERLAEQLEQRHPKEWGVTTDPHGRTYFWHRRSRRASWRLRGHPGGEEEAEGEGHCLAALHDSSVQGAVVWVLPEEYSLCALLVSVVCTPSSASSGSRHSA